MESIKYFQSDTILLSRVEDFDNLKTLDIMLVSFILSNGLVSRKNVVCIHMLNITEVLKDWVSSSCILTNMSSDISYSSS